MEADLASLDQQLSAVDVDTITNVYVRDNQTNTTILVSRANGLAGAGANGFSDQPSISADGDWVAFRSNASNLFDGDEGGANHIYKLRELTGPARNPAPQGQRKPTGSPRPQR